MLRFARIVIVASSLLAVPTASQAKEVTLVITSPQSPPNWALLQRQLLKTNAGACQEFFAKYFDERGFLLCVERWGGDDGPDDAIENVNDWPILHALGSSNNVLRMYRQAWEGHLRQYTLAKTTEVPFARDGMYYKEFPVTFDWVHNGEGLTVFNLQGLSDAGNRLFKQRVRRFAGFYMNEDPGAMNYDPKHRIIRSLFNGSRGPLLRKATGLDWAGDPIEVKGRFDLGHGEETYDQMVAHFKDYNDIIGDHPQNLLATSLALNAYMLSGQTKYRKWMLEYVDAWRERMAENDSIIPTNIGLDGKIGSAADGKWYGGVYGWGFTVTVPQTGAPAHRNTHYHGLIGFMNAYMLTGDDRYLQSWRDQIQAVNKNVKMIDGKPHYPRMFGDQGWYDFRPSPYQVGIRQIYYLSMKPGDRKAVAGDPWHRYLAGDNPGYPEAALRSDLSRVRERVRGMRHDKTTPDTRLADDPMKYNPASITSLLQLMLGGIHPGHCGSVLHARLRYFDPVKRRAGIPVDVAALVEKLTDDSVTVLLVNTNQLTTRELIVQAGAYGEHSFRNVTAGDTTTAING
ncbi:MAG: hypothetical protein VB877_03935, partial [Pirellulaceae bacterium]